MDPTPSIIIDVSLADITTINDTHDKEVNDDKYDGLYQNLKSTEMKVYLRYRMK